MGAGGAAERMELWVSGPPERPLGESGAGARTRPSGVSTLSSSSNQMARAVDRWRPFLFEVLILRAAMISAYRSIPAAGIARVEP